MTNRPVYYKLELDFQELFRNAAVRDNIEVIQWNITEFLNWTR